MQVLVDTNVLVRIVEQQHVHHAVAVESLRNLSLAGHILHLVPQVHYEFWVVATRSIESNGLGMTSHEVAQELEKLSDPLFRFLRDERAIYNPWHELVCKYAVRGKQSHDARLVAAMIRHGLTHILTFNAQDFARFSEIAVIEPTAAISSR
jgi:predicted nucleic acid-binding protein